jgi:hypothetical protein
LINFNWTAGTIDRSSAVSIGLARRGIGHVPWNTYSRNLFLCRDGGGRDLRDCWHVDLVTVAIEPDRRAGWRSSNASRAAASAQSIEEITRRTMAEAMSRQP